jgi:site-specific recombinase XerD
MTHKKTTSIPKSKAGQEGDIVQKVNQNFLNYLQAQVTTNSNSIREYIHVIRQFEEYLQRHNKTPNQVSQDEINGFMVELKTKYGNNSMIPKTAGLRHYARYLGLNPEKGGNIRIEMPTSKQTRKGQVLTEEDVLQFFNATKDNPLSNAVIKTLYYCGLRRMELINLDIEDIDFDNKIVLIRNGKGVEGEPERISISDIALESIQGYLKVRQTPREEHQKALFLCSTDTRINKTSLLMLIREARLKTDIKRNVYPHMFRASIFTHMHNNGADILHIKELSRHKDTKSLEVYIRSSDKQKKENYDRYVPKIVETEELSKPIPTPPQPKKPKTDPMIAEPVRQPPIQVIQPSKQQELLNLLIDGLITDQQYRDYLTKHDTNMFG